MNLFKLDTDCSTNDKLFFSFISDGAKTQNSIKRIAGCDTATVKRHVHNLIKYGYINSDYNIIVDKTTLCKWGYIKNVQKPDKLNLGNWIISSIRATIKSMAKEKRPSGIQRAMVSLGIISKGKKSLSDKRKIERWTKKLNVEMIESPEVAAEEPIVVIEGAEVALVEIEASTLVSIEEEIQHLEEYGLHTHANGGTQFINDGGLEDSILYGMHPDDIKDLLEIEKNCRSLKLPVKRIEIKNKLLKDANYAGALNPIAFVTKQLKEKYIDHEKVLDKISGVKVQHKPVDLDKIKEWHNELRKLSDKSEDAIKEALMKSYTKKYPVKYALSILKRA